MAKPNQLRDQGKKMIPCDYSDCVVMFGRNQERRRHVRETHGAPTNCCVVGCKWTSKRMERLRSHLDKIHRHEASNNRTLAHGFRATTSLPLPSSSSHSSTPDTRIDFNVAPTSTPSFKYFDYNFWPRTNQSQQAVSECYASLSGGDASQPNYKSTFYSLGALRARTRSQGTQYRIPRSPRVRRRTPRHTATRTSSTAQALVQRGSAMASTVHIHSSEQDGLTPSMQAISEPWNVEVTANFLYSLNLDFSMN